MNDLPPEILTAIFDFAGIGTGKAAPLLAIASVSRYWQDTIRAHPHYWTKHSYTVPSGPCGTPVGTAETIVKILSCWFDRAGDRPLTLELNCHFGAQVPTHHTH